MNLEILEPGVSLIEFEDVKMINQTYEIVSRLHLSGIKEPWSEWNLFRAEPADSCDLEIIVRYPRASYGIEIIEAKGTAIKMRSGEALLCANDDWSRADIFLSPKEDDLSRILCALMLTHLSTRKGLLFHGSLIDVGGRGILFLGPSGIGKTTQAELWNRYRGADIVNGDMTFVCQKDGVYYGCGSPWHGSSSYCMNRQVPLVGMIVLEQRQENKICLLKGMDMLERVLKSAFFPNWYQRGTAAAGNTLDDLLENVPVYRLECRPDEEAIITVEKTMKCF